MLETPTMVLDYIAIKTHHFEEMVAFYHQIIGMDELNYEDNLVYLGIRSRKKPLIVLIDEEDEFERGRIYKIAFKMKDRTSFDELLKHLNKTRHIDEIHDYGFVHSFMLNDPDGNIVEFYMESDRQQWPAVFPESNIISFNQPKQTIGMYHLDPDTVLGHLHLTVGSLAEMRHFYRHILNLEHKSTTKQGEHHFASPLSMAGDTLMSVQEGDATFKESEIDFIAFQMMNMDDLQSLKNKLEQEDYPFYYNKGKKIIAIDDPDETSLWFQVRGV